MDTPGGDEPSQIAEIARQLTDVCGPRLTNSPGWHHAAAWATQTVQDGTVFVQSFIGYRKKNQPVMPGLQVAEEQGLLGSFGYVKNHFGNPKDMHFKPGQAKVSAYFNLDNGSGRIRGIFAQGNDKAAELRKPLPKPEKFIFEDLLP
jgi:hypothetical protein